MYLKTTVKSYYIQWIKKALYLWFFLLRPFIIKTYTYVILQELMFLNN